MKKTLSFRVFASSLLLPAAGCGVEGNWVARDVQPAGGDPHYNWVRASFNPDQSFTAVAKQNGKEVESKGTYAYNPWTHALTLKTRDSKELHYTAQVWWGNELRVQKQMKDQTVTVVMDRGSDCPRCAQCSQCSSKK
jgi:hypothetical protein